MQPETALLFSLAREHLGELLPHEVREKLKPQFEIARSVLEQAPQARWQRWLEKTAIVTPWQNLLQSPHVDPVVYGHVLDALFHERQLLVGYRSYDPEFHLSGRGWWSRLKRRFLRIEVEGGVRSQRIHPLGLVRRDQIAYLVASFHDYSDIRLLALHRIANAQILELPVCKPKGYPGLASYIEDGHLNFMDDCGPVNIHLRFHHSCYQSLHERPPKGDGVTISRPRHGFFELTGRLPDSWTLRWWLLGFGDLVEIIEPAHLCRELQNLRFDQVTGLRVRKVLDDDLQRQIAQARRTGQPLSLLMLDVDDFGRFNKLYGPLIGDRTLRHIADIIKQQVRTMDIVGRYGGEEFVVVLPNTGLQRAMEVARRIQMAISAEPVDVGENQQVSVTACIGVVELNREKGGTKNDGIEVVQTLYGEVGAALRTAKGKPGKNYVSAWRNEL